MEKPIKSSAWTKLLQEKMNFLVSDYSFTISPVQVDDERYRGYITYNLFDKVRFEFSGSSLDSIHMRIYQLQKNEMVGYPFNVYAFVNLFFPLTKTAVEYKDFARKDHLDTEDVSEIFEHWANILQAYCQILLKGEFSSWDELRSIENKKIDEFLKSRRSLM